MDDWGGSRGEEEAPFGDDEGADAPDNDVVDPFEKLKFGDDWLLPDKLPSPMTFNPP